MSEMAEFIIIEDEFDEDHIQSKPEEDSNILFRGNVNETDYVVTFASPGQDENSGYITPDLNSIEPSNANPTRYRPIRPAEPLPSDPLGESEAWKVELPKQVTAPVSKARVTSEVAQWTKPAVLAFIKAYETISRNSMNITRQKLWEQVSASMLNQGFKYSTAQCSAKYKTLIRQYRAVKAYNATRISNEKRDWQYYEIVERSIMNKNYWGVTSSSESNTGSVTSSNALSTGQFNSEDSPGQDVEENNIEIIDFSNGSPASQSGCDDSLPEKNLNKTSTSNTAMTGRPGTVKGLLQKLMNQKAQHEKARQERHLERMQSDDRLYRILEILANKL